MHGREGICLTETEARGMDLFENKERVECYILDKDERADVFFLPIILMTILVFRVIRKSHIFVRRPTISLLRIVLTWD